MEATQANINSILKNHPLNTCEISCGLNDTGDVTEVLYIYPHRKGGKTFDQYLKSKKERAELANDAKLKTEEATQ